ncbi:unnamed protein product [Auanema sp. JU1783]|nr:unnamed protein product [Auanema sp. JU1783]
MTLQWSIVAFVLYVEIAFTFILLLPWIRPSLWSKLFKSRLVSSLGQHALIYSYAFTFVLFILFADSVREVHKYSVHEDAIERTVHTASSESNTLMKLFRAQRNFYISGFALLLFLVIKRIISLLNRGAQMEAASEAAMRQAESASKVAKTLMNAGEGESSDLNKKIEQLTKELKSAYADRDAVKAQAKGLEEEYDRVAEKLSEYEKSDSSNKKSN